MADLLEQTLCINQRFKHEYADIESVGEGGYGEVFKCRHKIDGATYALKAVRFSINKHKNEIKKILMEMTLNYHLLPDEIKKIREVIIMSRMQHKNIVRYFDSWIEKSEDQTTEYDDEYSDDESNHDNTVSEQTSGSDVIFSEGAPALKDQMTELEDSESRRYKLSELTSGSGSSILFEGGSGLNVQMSDLEDPQYKIKLYLVLYIKMEYVPYTLKGYINEQKLYSDYKKYFGFAREIAEGLQYMHSEKVVHRDLTTVNIFITANEEIKLADFGLSRIITSKNMKIETPQKKESNRDLTMCIGTPMYAAPEIETELYGPEVDLFSFGLCLFEMCYAPINTNQEKDHLFKLLRRGKLPDDFGSTHIQKRAAKLISGLLKPKPSERLSLEFIISEDFLSNDAENQEVIQEGSGMQNGMYEIYCWGLL